MKMDQLQRSIKDLTQGIIDASASHMEKQGLVFDPDVLRMAVLPMIEFVSETAHFVASDALSDS